VLDLAIRTSSLKNATHFSSPALRLGLLGPSSKPLKRFAAAHSFWMVGIYLLSEDFQQFYLLYRVYWSLPSFGPVAEKIFRKDLQRFSVELFRVLLRKTVSYGLVRSPLAGSLTSFAARGSPLSHRPEAVQELSRKDGFKLIRVLLGPFLEARKYQERHISSNVTF